MGLTSLTAQNTPPVAPRAMNDRIVAPNAAQFSTDVLQAVLLADYAGAVRDLAYGAGDVSDVDYTFMLYAALLNCGLEREIVEIELALSVLAGRRVP